MLQPAPTLLRVHASHGFAIETLHEFLGRAGVVNELRYCGSTECNREQPSSDARGLSMGGLGHMERRQWTAL